MWKVVAELLFVKPAVVVVSSEWWWWCWCEFIAMLLLLLLLPNVVCDICVPVSKALSERISCEGESCAFMIFSKDSFSRSSRHSSCSSSLYWLAFEMSNSCVTVSVAIWLLSLLLTAVVVVISEEGDGKIDEFCINFCIRSPGFLSSSAPLHLCDLWLTL